MAKLVNDMLCINLADEELPLSTIISVLTGIDEGALRGMATLSARTNLRPKMSVVLAPKMHQKSEEQPRLFATIELLNPETAAAVDTFNFYIGNATQSSLVEKRVCDAYDEHKIHLSKMRTAPEMTTRTSNN